MLLGIILDDFNALVWIRQGLDAMANPHNELICLLHLIDELTWGGAAIKRPGFDA